MIADDAQINHADMDGLKEEANAFLESLSGKEGNIICRDTQYDDGEHHTILFLLKALAIGVLPLAAGSILYSLIAASVDYRIQAGTWQAFASLFVLVAASVGVVLGIKGYARRNRVGNKFLYYVISDQGLYYTHLGLGPLGRLIRESVRGVEKIKMYPLWIYALVFLLGGHGLGRARQLARAEVVFKLNQQYHIAERLLTSKAFEGYCSKVMGVTRIREYACGCEITWKCIRNGVEETNTQIIDRHTENYALLMDAFRARMVSEESGELLGREERKQVYANILRRGATLLLGALIIAVVAVEAYSLYLKNTSKAQNLSDGLLKTARYYMANRAERRSIRGVYGIIALVLIPIARLIIDAVQAKQFTAVPVRVKGYVKSKKPFYYEVLNEFHYFANIEWKGEMVSVGLSKAMWKQRDQVEPLLVLRKGVPYCLVYRKSA